MEKTENAVGENVTPEVEGEQVSEEATDSAAAMFQDWGQRVESWVRTKEVADRAMGSLVADKVTLAYSSMCAALISA